MLGMKQPSTEKRQVCPVCGSEGATQLNRRKERHGWVRNVLCDSCQMVYVSPRATEQAYLDFYQQEYTASVYGLDASPEAVEKILTWRKRRSKEKIGYFPNVWKQGQKVLEIGAGTGAFLSVIRDLYKGDCYAIEPAPNFVGIGTKHLKLPFFQGTFDQFLKRRPTRFPRTYDAIILDQMLEHALDPVALLSHARTLLRDTGFLFISVPNIGAPKEQPGEFFIFEHVSSFSPRPLALLLNRCGFKVIGMHPEQPGSLQVLAVPFTSNKPMVTADALGPVLTVEKIRADFAKLSQPL